MSNFTWGTQSVGGETFPSPPPPFPLFAFSSTTGSVGISHPNSRICVPCMIPLNAICYNVSPAFCVCVILDLADASAFFSNIIIMVINELFSQNPGGGSMNLGSFIRK